MKLMLCNIGWSDNSGDTILNSRLPSGLARGRLESDGEMSTVAWFGAIKYK